MQTSNRRQELIAEHLSRRKAAAEAALFAYAPASFAGKQKFDPCEVQTYVTDLIVDLLHLATSMDIEDFSADECLETALMHYDAEVEYGE